MTVEERAEAKLAHIIETQGDAGGERRKPYYLAALVDEIRRGDCFSEVW